MSAEFGSYRFVQSAVRQAACGSLSRRDRKWIHLAVIARGTSGHRWRARVTCPRRWGSPTTRRPGADQVFQDLLDSEPTFARSLLTLLCTRLREAEARSAG